MNTNINRHAHFLKQFRLLNIFVLCVVTGSITAAENRGKFDPESDNFSKMETIKSWTATRFHNNQKLMNKIQQRVAAAVPSNPEAINCIKPAFSDDGKNTYGKSFYSFPAIELPCLQKVHELSLQGDIHVVEFAASRGKNISWKILLAVEGSGTYWCQDLGSKMLEENMANMRTILPPDRMNMVRPIVGNCLNFAEQHPELTGQVDVIFCQNLRHFLSPELDQKFLKTVSSLLRQGGFLYDMSNTIRPGADTKGNPLFDLYIKQKKDNLIYPGWMKMVSSHYMGVETQCPISSSTVILKVVGIPENISPYGKTLKMGQPEEVENRGQKHWLCYVEQEETFFFFTPNILKAAVKRYNEKNGNNQCLTVCDSYFVDQKGKRHNEHSLGKEISFAAEIVRKD
jgi:CheR methyltransferase, SAM binding domain